MRFSIIIFFLVFSFLTNAQNNSSNSIIVKLKSEYKHAFAYRTTANKELEEIFQAIDLQSIHQLYPKIKSPRKNCFKCVDLTTIYEISFNSKLSVEKLISSLSTFEEFEYVTIKPIPHLLEIPDDPLNTTYQYYLDNIEAYAAYDISKGDSTIVIGILDTGIDLDHEDLIDNIAYNSNDSINGIDDDNDGFTDNFRGWDLGENDNNPQVTIDATVSGRNHGIHVAGVSSATTNNNIGITGVGYKCKFLPIKVSNDRGILTHSYEGIVYAADHGCQIINCSWGNTYYNPYAEDVIKYAVFNKGCLVIAAGGNDGNEGLYYPASFDYVISVAATNAGDIKWGSSNYNHCIDISAPGSDIYFTSIDDQYSYGWGTSFAAPVVAGCAGIAKAHFPDYTMLQIGELLKTTVDIIDTIPDNQTFANKLGSGRVNIYKALTKQPKPSIAKELIDIVPEDEYFTNGTNVDLYFSYTNYLSQVSKTNISLLDETEYLTYTNSSFFIDTLKSLEVIEMDEAFSFTISEDIPFNQKIDFEIVADQNILINYPFFDLTLNRTYLDIENESIKTTITSNGKFGYINYSEKTGNGFVFNNLNNFLFQSAIMAGNSTYKTTSALFSDNDYLPINKPIISDTLGNIIKITSRYKDDPELENSSNISFTQNTFYNTQPDSGNFIVVEFIIYNNNSADLNDFYFSIFADWDIVEASANKADYIENEKLIYTYSTTNQNYYAGIQAITNQNINYYNIDNIEGGNGGVDVTNGFSIEEKYFTMTNNRFEAGDGENGNDVINIISFGPIQLNANDSAICVASFIAAENLYILKNSAEKAKSMYELIYTSVLEKEVSNQNITIYPTLASSNSKIRIESKKKISSLSIINSSREILLKQKVDKQNNFELDIPVLTEGFYFLIITDVFGNKKLEKIVITE